MSSEMENASFENVFVGQDWDLLMQKYLDKFGDNERIEAEISSLFFKLSKNLEKKSLFFWHIKSFQDYIQNNINPLGLRIQIFPTLEDLDTDFKSTWENILQTCSRSLMETLINEYTKRTNALDIEITKICELLKKLRTHQSVTNKEKKLKIHLESFNKDILIKKNHKFQRDKNAFETGKAYKWNQNRNTNRNTNTIPNSRSTKPSSHNFPPPTSQTKTTLGTKRQFQGEFTQDQKSKKHVSERTPLSSHTNSAPTDKSTNASISHHAPQQCTSKNHDTPSSHEPSHNDSSFLDQILAGVKPPPPNLNTYTQMTL